jgi:hypothetical protein
VEAARLQGEAELETLREQHREKLAVRHAEQDADWLLFQRQKSEAEAPQRAAQQQADKKTFLDGHNTLRSFSNNKANWNVVSSTLGPGFRVYDLEQALVSNAIQLSKPGQAEIDQWAQDDVERHNKRLLSMSVPELKQEMLREQTASRAASSQREENQLLEEMRQRDVQMNYPPLPSHHNGVEVNSAFLKRLCNTEIGKYRFWLKKFGGYQLSCRLMGRA